MDAPPFNRYDDRLELPARLSMLPAAATFAQDFCACNSIGHDDALRLILLIEELFSNTVRHGYGGECDAPILIALAIAGEGVTLLYEDQAPRFDPLAYLADPPSSLSEPLATRPVGGLGVHLLNELAADARYAYEQERNRLWLTLQCRG